MESSIVSELEGTLLKDHNPFSYFMLLAFEVSGLLRFVLLLIFWPVIQFLGLLGMEDSGLKLMIFVAMAGIRESEINSVARAVLPKFYMDDLNVGAWKVFSSYDKRVVVTKTPRIMVEWFLKEHLQADEVIGIDLVVNRFGLATGFIKGGDNIDSFITTQIAKLFMDEKPFLGLGRSTSNASFLSLCKEKMHPPVAIDNQKQHDDHQLVRPLPVIFHDGRLVKRPTPSTALLIILWLPLGILLATFRIVVGLMLPMWAKQYVSVVGGKLIVKGKPPSPACGGDKKGVLFVSNHRTLMDPVVISAVLGRRIPAATYSISRLSEILSPIPTFRLTRIRDVDAEKMKRALADGGLVVCPEGTTCREPFLLRFSALFAELTNRIVPVAMNCRVGFFHATTARGWKALDPIFLFMNPRPVYEVTFLNQLPLEATCSTGKSPHDVANYVQRILAATLGFECTNFTREDKYRILAGNDGTVTYTTFAEHIKKVIGTL